MSEPGQNGGSAGGRGRAGSRLRTRVMRNVSPGRGAEPPTAEMGRASLRDTVSSASSSSSIPPQRGASRSPDRAGNTRGVVRGIQDDAGGRRGPQISRTRPDNIVSKEGKAGQVIELLGNFFVLWKAPAWTLRQYRVDFEPALDNVNVRNAMLRQHGETLGGYIYDKGSLLYTSHELPEALELTSADKLDPAKVYRICVKFARIIEPGDGMNLTFYNTTLRKCLFNMGLEEFGRSFYDSSQAQEKVLSQHRLKLWPGFTTSIRNHENNVLLCVETTHKVLRMDSVLVSMNDLRSRQRGGGDVKQFIADEIVGSIVLTTYNKKTYSVSDIDWDKTPASTFDMRGTPISYAAYYKDKYNLTVSDMKQPLLLTVAKKRDFHRGARRDEGPEQVYLVPEFCQMTGLTEAMRANFTLMKDMAKYLHEGPAGRIETLKTFIKRLRSTPENRDYLEKWGVDFKENLLSCKGRILEPESIVFAEGNTEVVDKAKADWTLAFRKRKMLTAAKLEKWVMLVPQRDRENVNNLITTMIRVAEPLGFFISKPEIITLQDTRVGTYIRSIQEHSKKPGIQLMFIILPSNNVGTYGAIKKKLSAEIGLQSQCFLSKNVASKGLMSIATKVVIQMNAKLGGEPWSVKIPLKKMMTVGFDVYHGGKVTAGRNVGALVASVSQTQASFYSTVSFFSSTDEMSRNLCTDFIKSLEAYAEANSNELPERILFFRDGVGEGQLEQIIQTELAQVQQAMDTIYNNRQLPSPKFTFVVVSKKINTRLFKTGRPGAQAENPPPGTVCDNEVTLPERYDFFLIPQVARQGAVSPTAFNILFDSNNLDPDKIQRLAYKMCHLYFNWSGTVAVPAPCQYAHKLAHQTGIAIGDHSSQALSYYLHFL